MMRRLAAIFKFTPLRWVAVVTLVVAALILVRPRFTEFLELKIYDLKFLLRGPLAPGPEVVIVSIDDASVQAVGRWPWSREIQSKLLTRLKEAEPRTVAIDIIFAEREETAGLQTLRKLRQDLSQAGLASPPIVSLLKQEEQRADVDRLLAQAVAQGPPTILGYYFREVGGGLQEGFQPEQLMGASYITASTYNMVRLLDADAKPTESLIKVNGVQVNLPDLTAAAAGGGYFNMLPDDDGIVRWLLMAVKYGSDVFAPMTLVTPAHYLGSPPMGITLSQQGIEEIRLGKRQVPVDRHGRLWINFLGKPGTFPTYSAEAVLGGRVPREALRDRIVLVGATAVGLGDVRATPFDGLHPGTEIQATVMDNLLHNRFMYIPYYHRAIAFVIILILGGVLGLALPRLSALGALIFVLGLLEGYLILNYLLFSRLGLQLQVFYPVLEIAGVHLGITLHSFLKEEKERVRLRKTFEAYVAPAVVHEMMKHPERLRLGGERREMTILFTDIRGFTTLSEGLAPEVLVALLHDFLNPMSNIIIENGGTIDKYIGDAIMALFGAPLIIEDHARLACRTALGMVSHLKVLGQQWAAQDRPQIHIGVGINSGLVAVGNMGSDRLFDYTAIGDNVNLASRLEGLNKYYGTDILVSDATARAVSGEFILREVDQVQVKGKVRHLRVWELLGEGTPEPELAAFLETYQLGLNLYRDQNWDESIIAFEKTLQLRPGDPLGFRYLTLSQRYRENPPGPDWEAITVMEGK